MSLLQTMLTHLDSPECEPSQQAAPSAENDSSVPEPELFVSTDLDTAQFEWAVTSASDVEYNGKIYRRLEPEYFAWLRSRMLAAQSAFKAGKLSESTWESLKSRFNPLQEYAVQKFGKESLRQASRQISPQNYQAPRHVPANPEKPAEPPKNNWIYPPNEAWNCIEQVSSDALAKVDAIKEEAMSRKWSEARLYQNQGRYRFPCGQDYGLVCFVGGDRKIGAVTERYIEIIHSPDTPRPSTLRFHNPDVPQPWLKKVESNHEH
jgi:hypothetical protein